VETIRKKNGINGRKKRGIGEILTKKMLILTWKKKGKVKEPGMNGIGLNSLGKIKMVKIPAKMDSKIGINGTKKPSKSMKKIKRLNGQKKEKSRMANLQVMLHSESVHGPVFLQLLASYHQVSE